MNQKLLNGELNELSEFFLFTGGHKGSESAKSAVGRLSTILGKCQHISGKVRGYFTS